MVHQFFLLFFYCGSRAKVECRVRCGSLWGRGGGWPLRIVGAKLYATCRQLPFEANRIRMKITPNCRRLNARNVTAQRTQKLCAFGGWAGMRLGWRVGWHANVMPTGRCEYNESGQLLNE